MGILPIEFWGGLRRDAARKVPVPGKRHSSVTQSEGCLSAVEDRDSARWRPAVSVVDPYSQSTPPVDMAVHLSPSGGGSRDLVFADPFDV